MARYRKIDPRIWNDEKFASLRDDAQLAFLFVLTHPLMTSLGALRGSPEGLAGEKYGWSPEKKGFREGFREAFVELAQKGLLKIDPKGLIFVPNFLKYNRPESPNVIKAWKGSLDLLPECPLLEEALKRAEACVCAMSKAYAEAFREAFAEEFEKPSAKAMPNQEQEQEPEQEQEYIEELPDGSSLSTTVTPTASPSTTTAAQPGEANEKPAATKTPIPCQRVADLYNEKLGRTLRACKTLNATRRSLIGQRWRDIAHAIGSSEPSDVMDGWSAYFDKIARSDFLMGRVPPSPGHSRRFEADFDWILNSRNYTSIFEGKYENGKR